MGARADWRADRERYPAGITGWSQQGLWASMIHRYGQWARDEPRPIVRGLAVAVWRGLTVLAEVVTKISIGAASVGPGLRVHHFGPVVVNHRAVIGARCTMEHGVTIGDRTPGGPAPVIGDDVQLGAYAQVLGAVVVGDGARVGALSVVLHDVPAGATVVGAPARVVSAPEPDR